MFGVSFFTPRFAVAVALINLGFSPSSIAQENKCLGTGTNPFYINDLQKKMDRVKSIKDEIRALKEKNDSIPAEIDAVTIKRMSADRGKEEVTRYNAAYEKMLIYDVLNKEYSSAQAKIEEQESLILKQVESIRSTAAERTRVARDSAITKLNQELEKFKLEKQAILKVEISNYITATDAVVKLKRELSIVETNKADETLAQYIRTLNRNVDTAVSTAITKRLDEFNTKRNAFNLWKEERNKEVRLAVAQSMKDNPNDLELVKKLNQEFSDETRLRQSEVDAIIPSFKTIPEEAKNSETEKNKQLIAIALKANTDEKSRIERQLSDDLSKVYANNIANIDKAKALEAKFVADKTTTTNNTISVLQKDASQTLGDIETAYENNIRKANMKIDAARIGLKKTISSSATSHMNKRALSLETQERIIVDLKQRIDDLALTIPANNRKIKELNKELEGLKFISEWMEESPMISTDGTVCTGDCEKLPAKVTFQTFNTNINPECIEKAIELKSSATKQYACSDSNSPAQHIPEGFCYNKLLTDFIAWSINKAIDCLSVPFKKFDTETTAQKIFLESGGKISYRAESDKGVGGMGLSQLVFSSGATEMGGVNQPGRKLLARTMASNTSKFCESYNDIIDYKKENQIYNAQEALRSKDSRPEEKAKLQNDLDNIIKGNPNADDCKKNPAHSDCKPFTKHNEALFDTENRKLCEFMSLEEGLQRNILFGIGLYQYYKDGYYDRNGDGAPDSNATDALAKIGISPRNPDYEEIKSYIALGMFGEDGPNGMPLKINNSLLYANSPDGKKTRVSPDRISARDFKKNLRAVTKYFRDIEEAHKTVSRKNDGKLLECIAK